MPTISLDGSEYELEHLSDAARQSLIMVRSIDEKLSEQRTNSVIYQVTANSLSNEDAVDAEVKEANLAAIHAKVAECNQEMAILTTARNQFVAGFKASLN
jgi:hypothetical protein